MIHEQYDEAVKYFKTYLNEEQRTRLSEEQLNWYANAYRVVQNKRDHMMEFEDSVQYEEDYERERNSSMLDDVRDELIEICADVVGLVDSSLLQNVEISTREKVFAYKIKGDFLR